MSDPKTPRKTGFQKRQLCKHEPEWDTVTPVADMDGVMDVFCKKCGTSGSFRVKAEEIMW
jgi:hypothetical protein